MHRPGQVRVPGHEAGRELPQDAVTAIRRVTPLRIPVPERRIWLVAIAVVFATIVIQGYRLSAAPDVFGDEGAYLTVARNLANGAGLTGPNGLFLWHPPLYMLIEAALIKLLGLGHAEPLSVLFTVRWINIAFSAATAGLLVLFGYRLRGLRMAAFVGVLFVLDPYVQRINRRNMLETATIFFVALALYLFVSGDTRTSLWRWLGPGLAFGLALLTKEPAAFFLLVPFAYSLFGARDRLGDARRATLTAAGLYLCYVAALAGAGGARAYWAYKSYGLERVSHALVDSPLGAPPGGRTLQIAHKVLAETNLVILTGQYASSFVLIGLAVVSAIILPLRFRRDRNVRLLVAWMAVSLASGAVLVRISDQYLYYVIVPAILGASYLLDAAFSIRRRTFAPSAAAVLAAVPLAGCVGFAGYRWVANYVTGSDNCYSVVAAYVRSHVPPGQTIESSNEVSNYFLAGRYDVRMDRGPAMLAALDVDVFILSFKDLWAGNQGTTPAFYDWVTRHSHLVLACYGATYWDLSLYYRGNITGSPVRAGAP